MVGCIYRHPSANLQEFTSELKSIIKQLKNNKHEVFILGDMNVDFLKYSMHADTEEYLDMLYLNNFIPIITKPTRITEHSSTLIDHIYTNHQLTFSLVLLW
jgi:endonuclease/exonuclease/phosphatase family metal-dependent hydrolase